MRMRTRTNPAIFVTVTSAVSNTRDIDRYIATWIIVRRAGHPFRGWPARLRGHKGSGCRKWQTVYRTSLYTTFCVIVFARHIPCVFVALTLTQISWYLRAREKATYSCPWANTGDGRKIPSRLNVCPWDLLIVMQYDSRSGNCVRSRVNGKLTSDGASVAPPGDHEVKTKPIRHVRAKVLRKQFFLKWNYASCDSNRD